MNAENMMVFDNPEFGSVRTLVRDGKPWFVGKDVATKLGYKNTKDALIAHVDEEDRHHFLRSEITTLESSGIPNRGLNFINESGLYALILSSKLPSAKRFKHWITSEVLPSIRKHGAYATDSVLEQLEENPDFIPDYIHRLRDENARAKALQRELEVMQCQLAEVQPKADYYNTYIDNKDALCFRYVAKELDVSERKLIQYLLDRKLLYRDPHRDNHVFPCSGVYKDLFVVRDFHTRWGHRGQYTLVTLKGRKYLMKRKEKIANYQSKEKSKEIDEICSAEIAGGKRCCTFSEN